MPISKLKNRQASQLDQLSARVGSKFTLRLHRPNILPAEREVCGERLLLHDDAPN